jgi:predicted outer membrane repeat protein
MMVFSALWRRSIETIRNFPAARLHRADAKRARQRRLLGPEALEDRLAPAVINVVNTADNNNPVLTAGHAGSEADPYIAPSLRSAISFANVNAGADTINLAVQGTYQITLTGANEDSNGSGDFDILGSGGDLLIQNASGGAVAVDGGGLDRVFDINPSNSANQPPAFLVTLQGFTVSGGSATGDGGAIRAQGNASLTLNEMVITANNATGNGGGIALVIGIERAGSLTVNNSQISNNKAGGNGGGIEAYETPAVVINPGSVLTGNTAANQGGAISVDSLSVAPGYMGVTELSRLTVTGALLDHNSASNGPGGAIANAASASTLTPCAVTLSDCTVESNTSGSTGGGLSDPGGAELLSVAGCLFRNNSAVGNGGAILTHSSVTTITRTLIEGNTSGGDGGGLFDSGLTLDIRDSTLAGNKAAGNGGGIELETTGNGNVLIFSLVVGSPPPPFLPGPGSDINNTTLAGNSAGSNGGAIDVPAAFTGSLSLRADTITGNSANNGGGVFWVGVQPPSISGPGPTQPLSGIAVPPYWAYFSPPLGIDVQSTILAMNSASTGPDASNTIGAFTDDGGNLIGVSGPGSGNTGFTNTSTQTGTTASPLDPLLGPLQSKGGPTVGAAAEPSPLLIEAPLPGSPAINAGTFFFGPQTEERGYTHTAASGKPAAGAVEFLTAAERFVAALYLVELGRAGTPAEVDGWLPLLASGGQQAVASTIQQSPEARDHLVATWYQTYLGRLPQNGEEQVLVGILLAGQSEEQVLSQVLGSPEFLAGAQSRVGPGSAQERVVLALYRVLLDRAADPSELAMQVGNLTTMGPQALALALLHSQEYRTDAIGGDYVNLLHRAAEPAGLANWVLSGTDLGSIRLGFEASAEFHGPGPLTGHGSGSYTSTSVPDAGVTYSVQGTADLADLGHVSVTGSLQSVGFIVVGQATGQLIFSNDRGSVTIKLTGPDQPGFAPLPERFSYQVVSGSGAFAHLSDQGTLSLVVEPPQVAPFVIVAGEPGPLGSGGTFEFTI